MKDKERAQPREVIATLTKVVDGPERMFAFAAVSGTGEGIYVPGSIVRATEIEPIDAGAVVWMEVVDNPRATPESPFLCTKLRVEGQT